MADRLRALCLSEEKGRDSVHSACYIKAEDVCKDGLVEYLGLFDGYPVAYLGIEVCDCGVLFWRYIYVPEDFRRLQVGWIFIKKMLQLLHKDGSNYPIEICYNANHRSIASMAKRLGFRNYYISGVATLEELLKK